MGKSTHFFGQPVFGQLLNYLNKDKVLRISHELNGEKYVKSFDVWSHLVTMLYAVNMRFDSLREIEASMLDKVLKLGHFGLRKVPRCSTLSDANARRPEAFFAGGYHELYEKYRGRLSSDSRPNEKAWMKKLQIMDSSTISLSSNLLFKGVGRNHGNGRKRGGIKVHAVIHANEGVPCDVKYTSAATHDGFMLAPSRFSRGDILASDRAYIDYAKFEKQIRIVT